LSEVAKFSSKDVRGWLERETRSVFVPIHSKAEKLVSEMKKNLQSLLDASKMLLENSGKEIEKRNMRVYGRARALNKLARIFVERVRQIKAPEEVTYDSFYEFVQETQKAFSITDIDIRNYFPRVAPFFILDRRRFLAVFERAKESLKELSNFLAKEYVKTKTLEETFQHIDKLQTLERQLVDLSAQKAKAENEMAHVERAMVEVKQRIDDVKSKGSLGQLSHAHAEAEVLGTEVKHGLQHLQKPFIKLQSLALHGEGSGLTPEETSKLNEYIQNPFEALAAEQPGYPLLKQILQKLNSSMSEGKLKLKTEKVRKAEQVIKSILGTDSLSDLHQKTRSVATHRKQLSVSPETAEAERHLLSLRGQLEESEKRKRIVEGDLVTLRRSIGETEDKIQHNKSEVEKNVLASLNKRIHIE
jgi:hypothetical protein